MQGNPFTSKSSFVSSAVMSVPITVTPETPIEDAIALLHKAQCSKTQYSENQCSCLLITQQQRPVGIFTKGDLFRLIAAKQPMSQPISTVMTQPVKMLYADDMAADMKDARSILQHMQPLRHLPVVNKQDELLGIITQSCLLQALLNNPHNSPVSTVSTAKLAAEHVAIDQIKGEFVAMVSHELRTPLTAIHGGIKLLSQGIVASQSEQGKHLLQVAAESSQRLVKLVDNVLELERLKSGGNLLHKQLINTQDVTGQIADSFGAIARQTNITLEICDPSIQLLADGDRLNQALTHLLDNAIKFSPSGSTVHIAVELIAAGASTSSPSNNFLSGQESALFTVRDQGIGIPSEQCINIFERFVQLSAAGSAKKGTGLGLTICRNIVEQHGGTLWVESKLGEGSCFHFLLPTA